jgi:hypothetical protein
MKRQVPFIVVATIAIAVPSALAWPGEPRTPPPKKPMPGAPPPAWIETEAKSGWLFYGTYCWKTACITLIAPETRPGLPVFTVRRGQMLRVHLGFAATSVSVSVDRRKVAAKLSASRSIISWGAHAPGIVTVSARASAGSPSYVARLRLR